MRYIRQIQKIYSDMKNPEPVRFRILVYNPKEEKSEKVCRNDGFQRFDKKHVM